MLKPLSGAKVYVPSVSFVSAQHVGMASLKYGIRDVILSLNPINDTASAPQKYV